MSSKPRAACVRVKHAGFVGAQVLCVAIAGYLGQYDVAATLVICAVILNVAVYQRLRARGEAQRWRKAFEALNYSAERVVSRRSPDSAA